MQDRIYSAMNLIPFGDSHTYFWGNQPQFPGPSLENSVPEMYWMGPAKIYGLTSPTKNQTRERFASIKHLLEQNNCTPVACLGEIDIRVNCAKEFIFNGTLSHITSLADLYLEQLAAIKSRKVIIWGPAPSAPDNGLFATDHPAYGDNQTRNYLTHQFNSEIIQKIKHFPNLAFVTFFYDLINPDLTTKPEALADGCHLSLTMHHQAINVAEKIIESDLKAVLNRDAFQSVRSYKRVFKPVTNWGKTPYINYYKKSSGDILHFFSYAPYVEGADDLLSARLEPI
jgi:hypothetical protein